MTLSDDELRAALERRASAVPPPVDLVLAARSIAVRPSAERRPFRRRSLAVGSAAASVVVVLALAGALAQRGDQLASHPPSAAGTNIATADTTVQPPSAAPVVWTQLVWARGDATAFTFPGNTFVQDATADGDGFIAVGYSLEGDGVVGRIWRTADGRSWDLVTGDWLSGLQLDHVLRFQGGFVVFGLHRQPDIGNEAGAMRPGIWWSADGLAWAERTPGQVDDFAHISGDASGATGILLAANDASGQRYWLRSDAAFRWTRIDAQFGDDVQLGGIGAGGPGWIATGTTGIQDEPKTTGSSKGAIWTSPDATIWTPAAVDGPGGEMRGVFAVAGGYVAYGSDVDISCRACFRALRLGPYVTWSSLDGVSWRRSGSFKTGIGNQFGPFFAADEGRRVLVFESGRDQAGRLGIEETLDGFNWHRVESSYLNLTGADVAAFPNFGVPFVGASRLIAFGSGPDDPDAKQPLVPIPWAASASSTTQDAATFPPRPAPSDTDVVCPNQEPCGPP